MSSYEAGTLLVAVGYSQREGASDRALVVNELVALELLRYDLIAVQDIFDGELGRNSA
jgi:hypothetical protein